MSEEKIAVKISGYIPFDIELEGMNIKIYLCHNGYAKQDTAQIDDQYNP